MLECVVNISEGRNHEAIEAISMAAGPAVLDVHTDPDHNRSVLTLVGEDAARAVTRRAVELLDVSTHRGAHPRIGVVDVVPFVPLGDSTSTDALAARDAFCEWAAAELALPCFVYGPERTLPEIRRGAFDELSPDAGPPEPHPTAGAVAVGARSALVAYNVWIDDDIDTARRVARSIRGPAVRALGLDLAGRAQVSMNLVAPAEVGPAEAYDQVSELATVERAELVGLLPEAVLRRIEPQRWGQLDLDETRTIEARVHTRDPDRRV